MSAWAARWRWPRPCPGVPTTQATSATGWSPVLIVAWTVPARHRGLWSWITQLHQDTGRVLGTRQSVSCVACAQRLGAGSGGSR